MENLHENSISALSPDITMWLDSYHGIFSDFDGREVSERNISEDFIEQLRRSFRENDSTLRQLNLLLPASKRDEHNEKIIINRLHIFFRKNHQVLLKRRSASKRKGGLFSVIGVSLMLAASYVYSFKSDAFISRLIFVILEPAGWFLVWTGFEHLLYSGRDQKSSLVFYEIMSKCKIQFHNK